MTVPGAAWRGFRRELEELIVLVVVVMVMVTTL
jgi:hypothetical protein